MSRKLLLGTVLLGSLALGAVLGLSHDRRGMWSRSVTQFRAEPIFDRRVRVSGYLVPNTLCKMADRCEHRFRIHDLLEGKPSELAVRYKGCVVPDTFREQPGRDTNVTVEGELCSGCHVFEAEQIMAKCPGKYEMLRDGGPGCGALSHVALRTCNARGEPNM